ncbi:MAG TPA: alpha/beta fold hydrolase [Acidobacteriaceae bacterium]|nr:alpha/beta fold hydrolase [Acidobacteriaceae bacterium]
MFEYDRLAPLEAAVNEVENQDRGALFDLSYRVDGDSARSQAWLILPSRSQTIPCVILLHGGGQDRGACLGEAWLLADRGIGSLLVDLPQARSMPSFSDPAREQQAFRRTVIRVLRGLDYLELRGDFDLCRGAIVGFSFGAWIASAVAAEETRAKRAILVACAPRMSEFWRSSPYAADIRRDVPPGKFAEYLKVSRSFDALRFLGQCSDTHLFFQCGADDELVSPEQAQEFAPYATGPNRLKMYNSATHLQMFFDPAARQDRISWLDAQPA